jgi:superfamily II DNA or RNA helicase/HKD family nuclease
MTLRNGLYDTLLTQALEARANLEECQIEPARVGIPGTLADAFSRQLEAVLSALDKGDAEHAVLQATLVNGLLSDLKTRASALGVASLDETVDEIAPPPRMLKAVQITRQFTAPPQIGLSMPWLFTAGKGSPSLLDEIRRELASADRIDVLVSFITISGVRKIIDLLKAISAVGAGSALAPQIRFLTTTYTGATEVAALDELARLPGCEVRVSLDGRRTRLHAKAWIFHRATGFGSAYVGSANLSGAALTGGLECTVKLAQRSQEALFTRAEATFETLWEDTEFERYEPENALHRQALVAALRREAGGPADPGLRSFFFDLHPKPYQQEMLEKLQQERIEGRTRNLAVAATGTGKTVVAAFDYRNTCETVGGRPKLLFIAHREEILRQALRTYREVLRDPEFGEVVAQGHEPVRYDHVFATIDSVASRSLVDRFGSAYWHTVVIDECHRLTGDRFDSLVRAVTPKILLGLTATPERSDGRPIAQYFDSRPDGSFAVELRLWHALDLQLLAPFEYYGCDDDTDLSQVPWDEAGERAALSALLSQNRNRAQHVIREWRRLASNPRESKALVFCVSIEHALFMTACLCEAGLPAACVVGTTDPEERRRAPQRLLSGELCALVTVDLFNEGVDIPLVDTLILLRPTQSPVLFQQQIGRGLRLANGKENCLVLDFVGQHRTEFRFDRLLSVLTGLSKRELLHDVEHGFSSLPQGCHISLQRVTRAQVLKSLKSFVQNSWRRLRGELQAYAALKGRSNVGLANFLYDSALEVGDVYRAATGTMKSGWTTLQREAGLVQEPMSAEEEYLSRRFGDLVHVDDPHRLEVMKLVGAGQLTDNEVVETTRRTLQMLAYQIDSHHTQLGAGQDFAARVFRSRPISSELASLADLLKVQNRLHAQPLPGLEDTPLCLHARYKAREILTAVQWLTADRRAPFQAGVLPLTARKTELLFVTLDKSEGYHDAIAYHDYAISAERFHWQTQNSAGPDTNAGRRYLESGRNGWQFQLFVRTHPSDPYRACGPVQLESAEGDRPMTIVWRLRTPLPIELFREFSALRGI